MRGFFDNGAAPAEPRTTGNAPAIPPCRSEDGNGYSFVISNESLAGPGFHGRPGYLASWRPVHAGRGAIKIIGSPFKSFEEAEAACNAMLIHLLSDH